MAVDYETLVTPSMVRELFADSVLDDDDKGYIISVCGKIVTIDGKIFFKTREQATKAFYNSFNWRARYRMFEALHPEDTGRGYGVWSFPDRSKLWFAFKRVLERDYGFKIMKA